MRLGPTGLMTLNHQSAAMNGQPRTTVGHENLWVERVVDKPHSTRRFSFVQPGSPLPTSWPGTTRSPRIPTAPPGPTRQTHGDTTAMASFQCVCGASPHQAAPHSSAQSTHVTEDATDQDRAGGSGKKCVRSTWTRGPGRLCSPRGQRSRPGRHHGTCQRQAHVQT